MTIRPTALSLPSGTTIIQCCRPIPFDLYEHIVNLWTYAGVAAIVGGLLILLFPRGFVLAVGAMILSTAFQLFLAGAIVAFNLQIEPFFYAWLGVASTLALAIGLSIVAVGIVRGVWRWTRNDEAVIWPGKIR